MHANVRSLNKKQPNYCKNCIAKMYENRDDIVSDLSAVISKIEILEANNNERLYKLSTKLNDANNLVN
jgi:hypothetical protein